MDSLVLVDAGQDAFEQEDAPARPSSWDDEVDCAPNPKTEGGTDSKIYSYR